ncbi:hypothetical protein QT970_18035 [Microcoleus sp. herbarium8]
MPIAGQPLLLNHKPYGGRGHQAVGSWQWLVGSWQWLVGSWQLAVVISH